MDAQLDKGERASAGQPCDALGGPESRPPTPAGRSSSATWIVPAALLIFGAMPVAVGVLRLVELAGGATITQGDARFFASPLPAVLHIVGAGVYALLGPFQFASGFRRRRPAWHRVAGRLLIPCGLLVGLSAPWMALIYPRPGGVGTLLTLLRLLFGSAMVVSIVFGVTTIRRGDVTGHRAWMLRGYAIGLGAATQMLILLASELIFGPPGELGRALQTGAGWLLNLAVAERAIRRRPVASDRATPVANARPGHAEV